MPTPSKPPAAIPIRDLSFEDKEAYLDRLEALQEEPSEAEQAFFANRLRRGLGVGIDDDGQLVFGASYRHR